MSKSTINVSKIKKIEIIYEVKESAEELKTILEEGYLCYIRNLKLQFE